MELGVILGALITYVLGFLTAGRAMEEARRRDELSFLLKATRELGEPAGKIRRYLHLKHAGAITEANHEVNADYLEATTIFSAIATSIGNSKIEKIVSALPDKQINAPNDVAPIQEDLREVFKLLGEHIDRVRNAGASNFWNRLLWWTQ